MTLITGVGLTAYGNLPQSSTLSLMARAATEALDNADLRRDELDGLLCAYSSTLPHFMLASLFAEYFGLQPSYAHAMQVGGATGFAQIMLAKLLVESGQCQHVLVVAGENRLSGQSRDAAIQSLAQVGHADFELPFGATIPAYYALVASRYMHEYGISSADLAELAVLMRAHACTHPLAQFRQPITVADVLQSKVIAAPLRLLDCCPVSDGGVAFVVSREPRAHSVRIRGCGQAHTHQHVSSAPSLTAFGSAASAQRAFAQAAMTRADVDYLAIYDSFTITLAILLEEIGFAPRGQAGTLARERIFSLDGKLPMNAHGGLLSFGHCGAGGGMAHIAEAYRQLTGLAGARSISPRRSVAFVHGDGGVLSSHVSLLLEALP